MSSTRTTAEDVWYVKCVAKMNQTTWIKILPTKLNTQAAKKTISHFEEHAIFSKESVESWRGIIEMSNS